MKIFFLFAPKFKQWPLATCRELIRRRHGASFCGLVTGEAKVYRELTAPGQVPISPLHYSDELERRWLERPADPAALEAYEKRLGPDSLRRLVVADRTVGRGFVTGGYLPRTPLEDICRDFEMAKRYLVGLLDHVFGVLREERPDLVFCYSIAGAPALAIMMACRDLGIPHYTLCPARVGSRYLVNPGGWERFPEVEALFQQALTDPGAVEGTLDQARAYLRDFRARPAAPEYTSIYRAGPRAWPPLDAVARGLKTDLKGRLKQLLTRSDPPTLRDHGRQSHALREMRIWWRSRRAMARGRFRRPEQVPAGPYAYYPLHVDPEASTMVQAPAHTDQLAVVESLAKSLPINMNLLVKEHVPMLGRRPNGFYRRLIGIPGVYLLDPFCDGFSLLSKAALTCVITGTTAWEAMLLGRPALVVGEGGFPHGALGQGVVECGDPTHLAEAVRRALALEPAEDRRLVMFLAALMALSVDLPARLLWGRVTEEDVARHPELPEYFCDSLLRALDRPVLA